MRNILKRTVCNPRFWAIFPFMMLIMMPLAVIELLMVGTERSLKWLSKKTDSGRRWYLKKLGPITNLGDKAVQWQREKTG